MVNEGYRQQIHTSLATVLEEPNGQVCVGWLRWGLVPNETTLEATKKSRRGPISAMSMV